MGLCYITHYLCRQQFAYVINHVRGTCFSYTGLLLGGGGVGEQCCAFIRTAKAIKPKDDHGYCIVSGFIPDQYASVVSNIKLCCEQQTPNELLESKRLLQYLVSKTYQYVIFYRVDVTLNHIAVSFVPFLLHCSSLQE